jgi:anti-sigma B factor antagonist
MKMQVETQNKVIILALEGRFDAHETDKVSKWLNDSLPQNEPRIIVDLTKVEFVDSSALATLVQVMKRSRENKGDVLLCGLNPNVRNIFNLTRLDRAFQIHEDLAAALGAFGAN